MKRLLVVLVLLSACAPKPKTIEEGCKRVEVGDSKEDVRKLFSQVPGLKTSHKGATFTVGTCTGDCKVANDANFYDCNMKLDEDERVTAPAIYHANTFF